MTEKQRKRLLYLKGYAHDNAVSTRSAKANGKLIPNLGDVENLFVLAEELIKIMLEEP